MDHYDEVKRQCIIINLQVNKLLELSSAFYLTGNEKMYIELSQMADDLGDCRRKISEAMSQKLHHDYTDMQKSIGQTLSAMANRGEGND